MKPAECPVVAWLKMAVPASMPDQVVAFALNMEESFDWKVELVGCSTYDVDDADWACPPEAWTSPEALELNTTLVGETWETAQTYVLSAVADFINQGDSPGAYTFQLAQAVCVGFVDGDLVRAWPPQLD